MGAPILRNNAAERNCYGFVRGLALLLFWVVSQVSQAQTNVLTYHNDNARTGQNVNETTLTPANVNSTQFGKLYSVNMDGYVMAQPLVMTNVNIPNQGTHNIAYVATENDSLYAIDADSGAVLWQKSFINPGAGVTTIPASDISSSATCISPTYGITGTPVIDPSTGTIYLVTLTKENGTHVQRLHAIDIATNAEKFGGPVVIQASVSGSGTGSQNGKLSFDPLGDNQRSALLLVNGHVIIAWGSYCDLASWHGWVMSYNAATLAQEAGMAITPNGNHGGIWAAGAGLAADANSDIYFASGNGDYDGTSNFGDTILKLTGPSNGSFTKADWFTPYNQNTLDVNDEDLGSGGVLLLPTLSSGQQLLVEVGKTGTIYLVDRNKMGKYCSGCSSDTQIVQEIPNAITGMWGMPAYWNGNVYFGGAHDDGGPADHLKAFSFNANNSGKLSTTFTSESAEAFNFPGPTPSISATGNTNGIVWIIDNGGYTPALFPRRISTAASAINQVLHAYDATNLSNELYNSNQAANGRDVPGGALQFTVPTVANGKVYVGSIATFSAFGLRNGPLVEFSPATVTFTAPVAVGQSTNPKTVTLTNTGTATLSITSISIAGADPSDFSQTNNCGNSVLVGANCTINVTFNPTAIGTRTASVSISDNVSGSPQTVPVTGPGTYVKLSGNGHGFPTTTVGQTSSPYTVTLTNVGPTTLTINSITLSGTNPSDFGETNNCGSSVAASASCTLTMTFHPTATGSRSALVSISDNGGSSPQTISLSGTGASSSGAQVQLSPSSVTFYAPVAVGQTTNPKTVTLTNTGTATLTISGISITGADPSDFNQTNTCGSSVAAGANCTINITFDPTAINTRTASVSISDNATGSPQTIPVSGPGTYVKLSGNGHGFPTTTVGQTSSPWTVTLTNVGPTALSISSITLGGTNPSDFGETNNCGSSVPSNSSCTLTMTFHPTATGSRSALVSISDNGGSSPQTISLSGTGQ